MDDEKLMYSLKDLESILNLSRPTLLKYCNAGTLPAVKLGSRWRVSKADLDRYLKEHSNGNR